MAAVQDRMLLQGKGGGRAVDRGALTLLRTRHLRETQDATARLCSVRYRRQISSCSASGSASKPAPALDIATASRKQRTCSCNSWMQQAKLGGDWGFGPRCRAEKALAINWRGARAARVLVTDIKRLQPRSHTLGQPLYRPTSAGGSLATAASDECALRPLTQSASQAAFAFSRIGV